MASARELQRDEHPSSGCAPPRAWCAALRSSSLPGLLSVFRVKLELKGEQVVWEPVHRHPQSADPQSGPSSGLSCGSWTGLRRSPFPKAAASQPDAGNVRNWAKKRLNAESASGMSGG
ncbi:hypothetical protein GHT09_014240 [Marmota monax]|uniref:Uncharacterized protein n=1 Tax=Marmota monax TaxID=9995 RepID=A0A834UJW2_MARMO|nr:hypothetical protein GHT09_014240 [Marmota monax]